MLVQDRMTKQMYNPDEKMKELMQMPWFIEQMKRMNGASFNKEGLEDIDYSSQEVNNEQRKNYEQAT
jgi:hypothetical protein